MKNYAPLFLVIASMFSLSCLAQGKSAISTEDYASIHVNPEEVSNEEHNIVSYEVEERVNSRMGTRITTYNVSHLSLIRTYDLGPNNTRTITPKYGRAKAKTKVAVEAPKPMEQSEPQAPPVKSEIQTTSITPSQQIDSNDVASAIEMSSPGIAVSVTETKSKPITPAHEVKYAYIDVTSTYERILLKGYKSVDMFKRVANRRFFDGDLQTAAKWYSELFAMTKDLDEEYYFRYAQALKSVSQVEKANEMMAIFESKISKNH